MAKTPTILDLNILGKPPGYPALGVAKGQALAEAASVCLEHQHHKSGKILKVTGVKTAEFRLDWPAVTRQMRMTHNDLQEATADGACAIAISLARELTGLNVIERSRKGTGFDYWLGKDTGTLFQSKSRLEVSGILKGDKTTIERRLRQKLTQTKRSDDLNLSALVCVVEFGTPQAQFVKREP